MHASFIGETIRLVRTIQPFYSILKKTKRYFAFVGDISPFKRYFHRIYTPNATHAFFSVETSKPIRKMRPFTQSWRKLSVISLLLETFRSLNAISIAFHTPNDTHAVFSVETCATVRKMRTFTRFWRKVCFISLLLEIFRRLNAASIAFNTPNAMHAVFSVETKPTVRKMRPYNRFWRNVCVIPLLLEIFRRLNATSIAFYTPNTMHASIIVETVIPMRKMRPITRFWWKLSVISLLLEIYRRLNAISIEFYTPHKPNCSQNATIYSILTKTVRYIDSVGDISTFKRYFHCILYAERYASQFHRRNSQTYAQNATIYSILMKIERYFAIVGVISPFKRYFHCLSHAECYARRV